jgi:short-subunit dehydrogenase
MCRRAVRSYRRLSQQRWRVPARRAGGDPARDLQEGAGEIFFGYVRGARAVLPRFREQGHGVLINNASVYSHVGAPWLTAWVSSKFAVRGFSEALGQEVADLPGRPYLHRVTVPNRHADLRQRGQLQRPGGQGAATHLSAEQVAGAILASALRPKREWIVGGAGRLVTVAEAVARAGSRG